MASASVAPASCLLDSPSGFGTVSRALHWGMAILFVWQFTSVILRVAAKDTAIGGFFWSTHYSVGFTLWLLVLVRIVWAIVNRNRRPRYEGAPVMAKAARLGHLALYALMAVVPTLSILRAIGGDRGFSVYGIELVAAGGERNAALMAPANAVHGLLGWTLLLLILGHSAMAVHHALVRRDGTLARMTRGHDLNGFRSTSA